MPFAICVRCQTVFIVGTAEEARDYNHCPNCGCNLETVQSDEVLKRIEQQRKDEKQRKRRDEPSDAAMRSALPIAARVRAWVAGTGENRRSEPPR